MPRKRVKRRRKRQGRRSKQDEAVVDNLTMLLARATVDDPHAPVELRLNAAVAATLPDILVYGEQLYGRNWWQPAWDELWLRKGVPVDADRQPEFVQLFLPWLALDWIHHEGEVEWRAGHAELQRGAWCPLIAISGSRARAVDPKQDRLDPGRGLCVLDLSDADGDKIDEWVEDQVEKQEE